MTAVATTGEPIFWTWVRILRRVELGFGIGKKRVGSDTVQHVAMMACTYGNPDGTRIRPSEERLARVCRRDVSTIRKCLKRLRDVGLFRRVFEGSAAGRRRLADEYRLEIPEDLAERVAMLDPDEGELVVPDGVEPPPVKAPRAKPAAAAGPEQEAAPGAAPGDQPVENPVEEPPVEASEVLDEELPGGNHRVLPLGTPGAAPQNTVCSTRPPTHAPPTHLPAHTVSPYGAEVEGETAGRREPPAESDLPPMPRVLSPFVLREIDPAEAYAAAAAELSKLPEYGHAWITLARRELGEHTPRSQLVIRAAALAAEWQPA
ncbi:hypothetical protein ACFYUV_38230 [Nonomuraea sp. NPDC003560]|uniref:hypothetical protein n=1 Tax=Nonomuraea sp. NPDC003560 TaxID=3364341 RepID=UPI00369844F1